MHVSRLTDQEREDVYRIRDMGRVMIEMINELGGSRELSLAKTKVEEAVFWAIKHITG
jgi:hypothetical protein